MMPDLIFLSSLIYLLENEFGKDGAAFRLREYQNFLMKAKR